jgi:hypothetical protein
MVEMVLILTPLVVEVLLVILLLAALVVVEPLKQEALVEVEAVEAVLVMLTDPLAEVEEVVSVC